MASSNLISFGKGEIFGKDEFGILRRPDNLKASGGVTQETIVSYTGNFQASTALSGISSIINLEQKVTGEQTGPFDHMVLVFNVTNSSGSTQQLVDPSYWFDHIEWKSDAANIVKRVYNDEMFFETFSNLRKEQEAEYQRIHQLLPIDKNYYVPKSMANGATENIFVPLHWSLIEQVKPFFEKFKKSWYLTLYMNNTPVTVSGNTGMTLNSIQIIYRTEIMDVFQEAALSARYQIRMAQRFLQSIQAISTSYTLTAGQTLKLDLSQVSGKVPYLFMTIRNNTGGNSNTGLKMLQNVDLGDNCVFQLTTPTQSDLLYNNAKFPQSYLKYHAYVHDFMNPDFLANRNIYYFPLCKNKASEAQKGEINGIYEMAGERNFLQITPDVVGTPAQFTITPTPTPAADQFYLSWRGSVTNTLAYNASASAIGTALSGLPASLNHPQGPLTWTASQALSVGAVVLTVVGPNGNIITGLEDGPQCVFDSKTTDISCGTTFTQVAVSGLPANGSYIFNVYAMIFRQFSYDPAEAASNYVNITDV